MYHSSYTRWSTNKLNYIAGRESCFTTPGTSPAHSSYSIKSLTSNTNTNTNTYRSDLMTWPGSIYNLFYCLFEMEKIMRLFIS